MKKIIPYFAFIICLFVLACSGQKQAIKVQSETDLPDGLYLLTKTCDDVKTAKTKKKDRAIRYNHRFIEADEDDGKCLVVRSDEYVPLTLQKMPDLKPHPEKRKQLLLELTPDAKGRLTTFTKKHLNKRSAIVISGEAVTMHKIRAVIDGGMLQITRCTDDACTFLEVELRDNVVKQ